MKILVYHDASDSAFWAIEEEWPGILDSDPTCVKIEQGHPEWDRYATMAGAMRLPEFRGELEFLSNFYVGPNPVVVDLVPYRTSEHAYQSLKMFEDEDAAIVRAAYTPGQAKKEARARKPKKDWDLIKNGIMLKVLRAKFSDPDLRRRLLATGDRYLVEHNTWRDTYWGVYNGVGENHLGKLLMKVREEVNSLGQDDKRTNSGDT